MCGFWDLKEGAEKAPRPESNLSEPARNRVKVYSWYFHSLFPIFHNFFAIVRNIGRWKVVDRCAYTDTERNVWHARNSRGMAGIRGCMYSLKFGVQYNTYNRYIIMTYTFFNPRPHMLFSHPRTHMGGGVVATPPCHFVPNWDRTVGQSPNESLGCCESNDTRVDLFRSYLDPSRSGQRKKDSDFRIYSFSQITFELRKIAE